MQKFHHLPVLLWWLTTSSTMTMVSALSSSWGRNGATTTSTTRLDMTTSSSTRREFSQEDRKKQQPSDEKKQRRRIITTKITPSDSLSSPPTNATTNPLSTSFRRRQPITAPSATNSGGRRRPPSFRRDNGSTTTMSPSSLVDKQEALRRMSHRNDENSEASRHEGQADAIAKTTGNATSASSSTSRWSTKFQELQERHYVKNERLSQSYCDGVLALCVAYNQWDCVLKVMEVMKEQELPPTEASTFRACLGACFEVGNAQAAQDVWGNYVDKSNNAIAPSPNDWSTLIATYCRSSDANWWRKAWVALVDEAPNQQSSQEVVPVDAYNALLYRLDQGHKWKDAVRLLYIMDQQQQQSNTDPSQVQEQRHPFPTVATYRLVVETCIHANQGEQAYQVLQSMMKKPSNVLVKPTPYIVELVITALANKLQWRRAISLLEQMDVVGGIPKTNLIYNRVIAACAKAGEVGMATNLLYKMKQDSTINLAVKPDIVSFNSVIAVCASSNFRWKQALKLLDQVHREPGVTADIITYTNAIRACARGENVRRALSLFQVVKDKGLKLDNYIYAAVMDACSKSGQWKKALELFQEMKNESESNKKLRPNAYTYSIAITSCANGGQWKQAIEFLKEMKTQNMKIHLITYNAAITALSKASRRNARSLAKGKASERFGGTSLNNGDDEHPLEDYINIDEEELWKIALELLQDIKMDGLEPDGFSYSAAISCCGSGGRWKEALELMKIMQKGNGRLRPNKIAYTAAITACGRSGRYKEAHELFEDMKLQGLQPDRVTYNALLSSLRIAQEPEKAYELWKDICGITSTSTTNSTQPRTPTFATARRSKSLQPDIITVTDVIASLTRSNDCQDHRDEIDQVFIDAVERFGILLNTTLDSIWEVDLSGLSFPVARAAVRYVLGRVLKKQEEEVEQDPDEGVATDATSTKDISFITGFGKNVKRPSTTLRDYIVTCLQQDFVPPIEGVIPPRAQGTVSVPKEALLEWIQQQQTHESSSS